MEQNQLQKIDPQQFGELVKLPDVLSQNVGLATRAAAACSEAIERVKAIDLTKVDAQAMEGHDAHLNELQVKLRESYKKMQERRKPFTQFFDEIKTLFTAEENRVEGIGKDIKSIRDNWQKEKGRRQQAEEQKRAQEQAKKSEEIEIRTYAKTVINAAFNELLYDTIGKLNNAFNGQTLASFDEYETKLRKYVPTIDSIPHLTFNPKPNYFTAEQVTVIYQEVAAELNPQLSEEYVARLGVERDRLIELIPSRKRELERIATDAQAAKEAEERLKREAAERHEQMKREAEDRKSAMQQAAEVEQMNASFDAAAEATPVVGIAKGTQVKRKYVVNSHKAWAAILQQWVSNEMAACTLDELQKKFGFARTAAEKRLNEGIELKAEGLSVENDYSTRATKAKKEVA